MSESKKNHLKDGSVRYRVRLDNEPYIERIEIGRRFATDSEATLIRFEHPIARFMMSTGQRKKVERGKGVLAITGRMIAKALYVN